MDPLHRVQFEDGVHPTAGQPRLDGEGREPGMTLRMLQQLQVLIGNCKPTAAICLAMQRKIDAKEQLNTLNRECMAENQTVETVSHATRATASTSRHVPTSPGQSSPRSWEVTADMSPNTLDKERNHGSKPKRMDNPTCCTTAPSVYGQEADGHDDIDGFIWKAVKDCGKPRVGFEAAEQQGLRPRRVNLPQGYDFGEIS